jgi:hypothetical protein
VTIGSSAEVQKLVLDTLKANSDVMALANNVYDNVPQSPFGTKTAYISFGPSDTHDDGSDDCAVNLQTTLQIDVWSIAVGAVECKKLVDLVRRAFTGKPFTLTENAFIDATVELARVMMDPDGATHHGVVQVSFLVEEPA